MNNFPVSEGDNASSRSARAPQRVALALGSNIGDRAATLRAAFEAVRPWIAVEAVSPLYETPAAYVVDQPSFYNAALVGTTNLQPLPLLWTLKKLESELGRVPTFRYGPRVIDLDLLLYGHVIMSSPELTIPHPRMAEREFALRPLADIAPNWIHPQTKMTVSQMLEGIPECSARKLSC
ncbi:MAG: 2-amino-4-hydroxy-6-hydroxymethyldihydropteridine diphosphokinase [Bdellovibrionales bacterium]